MDQTARDLAGILKTGKQDVKAAAAVLIAAQAAEMSSSDQLYVGGDSSAAKELVTALLLNSGDTTRVCYMKKPPLDSIDVVPPSDSPFPALSRFPDLVSQP
mmetsp:Transcript_23665/g.93380  ORF Transcript_23665/g.93380 Transcript_23665/m.93380 type:complete len:101 (-) Transcript_23665:1063-1365(-)